MTCKIYGECKQMDTEMCGNQCWKKVQLDFQYKNSNIPVGYIPAPKLDLKGNSAIDKGNYLKLNDYSLNVFKHVKQGRGVYIWGSNKGNGKTSWAIKIMLQYLKQLHPTIESFEYAKTLFLNVPILFKRMRDNIDNPTKEFKTLEKRISTCDLVVFDDIGTEVPSKWVKENLYVYITEREMNNKCTIYTSNIPLEVLQMNDHLGARIVDRICKQVGRNIIELKATSRRRNN